MCIKLCHNPSLVKLGRGWSATKAIGLFFCSVLFDLLAGWIIMVYVKEVMVFFLRAHLMYITELSFIIIDFDHLSMDLHLLRQNFRTMKNILYY